MLLHGDPGISVPMSVKHVEGSYSVVRAVARLVQRVPLGIHAHCTLGRASAGHVADLILWPSYFIWLQKAWVASGSARGAASWRQQPAARTRRRGCRGRHGGRQTTCTAAGPSASRSLVPPASSGSHSCLHGKLASGQQ